MLLSFLQNVFQRICTCPSKRADSLAVAGLLDDNIMGLILIAPLRPDWHWGTSWQGLLGISNQTCKPWPLSAYKIKITDEKSSNMRRGGQGKATTAPEKNRSRHWDETISTHHLISYHSSDQFHSTELKRATASIWYKTNWILHVTTVQLWCRHIAEKMSPSSNLRRAEFCGHRTD